MMPGHVEISSESNSQNVFCCKSDKTKKKLSLPKIFQLRYFPSTVGQKWLENEMTENFKNIGTLGCAEAPF